MLPRTWGSLFGVLLTAAISAWGIAAPGCVTFTNGDGEARLEVCPTAEAVLAGKVFLVTLRVISPEDIPEFTISLQLPRRWTAAIRGPCSEELPCPVPVFAHVPAEVRLVLRVSAQAGGVYHIPFSIPALEMEGTFTLQVKSCLDPIDVVTHWDVGGGRLDLSLPRGVTYERLLWAIAHEGEKIPYACRSLSRQDIDALVREWQEGG